MDNPENLQNQQYPSNVQVIEMDTIISKMSKDMTFLAILLIIYGALSCLTIIGALVGVPYIFAGLRMKEAAEQFKSFLLSKNISNLNYALERQQRMFFIFKVLAIIAIILFVIIILFYAAIFGVILSGSFPMFEKFTDAA